MGLSGCTAGREQSACRKGNVHLAFEKVETCSWKIGFVNWKWSNLNAPESYTQLPFFTFGVTIESDHSLKANSVHTIKGNAACGLLIEWKSNLQKWVSWTPLVQFEIYYPLYCLQFLIPLLSALFLACRKRKILHLCFKFTGGK